MSGPTLDRPLRAAGDTSVVAVTHPDHLQRIHDPDAHLVRWPRPVPGGLGAWLDALPAGSLPDVRIKVPLGAVEAAVEAAFAARGVAASPERHMLVADILLLAMLFSHVERTEWLAVRLEAVDHDACRRPHVDHVSTRLLCTYRGSGTEFGRVAGRAWQADLALARFEVGLVKGLLHPSLRDVAACRLAHRSPRFAAGDPSRLLVAIDRADAPSAAAYH